MGAPVCLNGCYGAEAGKLAPFPFFTYATGTDAIREGWDRKTRIRLPRKPINRVRRSRLTRRGQLPKCCRSAVFDNPPLIYPPSCIGLHKGNPILLQPIALAARREQQLVICRPRKANLVPRFAHHHLARNSESVRFHYAETEACRQAIELGIQRNTTSQRLEKSEVKYQVAKSASGLHRFPPSGRRLRGEC